MEDVDKVANFFKLFTNKARLKIIILLAQEKLPVYEIKKELDISQPSASHHLNILKKEGLINSVRQGSCVYHSLDKKLFKLFDYIQLEFSELYESFLQSTTSSKCRDEK
ncbi:ArsR/SmtB family transcription factor [Fuchsiella alkaliacetigena]|uniref:ArsR/SmtB family transcription factor n=1 Tax=Fuchsiella alkaliacetigena TaxID=957042 RepID=UPI00200B5543|nr:metalloregulator ArsR/SmtB family transcription factor [Fuchsiella alkaliacetigena]MCK8825626.1 metalloregulator ArsR/SmtB family transcription factor [Fuchsiella alkaliacetigena]